MSGSHTYAEEGGYSVLVAVEDDDGDTGQDSLTVDVNLSGFKVYLPLVLR